MKQYVVNKDGKKREVTDADIQRYKNFAEVKEKYQKLTYRPKPLYKDPKSFLALLFIVILVYLLFSEGPEQSTQQDQQQTEQSDSTTNN